MIGFGALPLLFPHLQILKSDRPRSLLLKATERVGLHVSGNGSWYFAQACLQLNPVSSLVHDGFFWKGDRNGGVTASELLEVTLNDPGGKHLHDL